MYCSRNATTGGKSDAAERHPLFHGKDGFGWLAMLPNGILSGSGPVGKPAFLPCSPLIQRHGSFHRDDLPHQQG